MQLSDPKNEKAIRKIIEESPEFQSAEYQTGALDGTIKAFQTLNQQHKKQLADAMIESRSAIDGFRETRMTVARELQQILPALKEFRQFFIGDPHEKEMARLKDFIETAERLKALKDSGFLDQISDVMLKLS